MDTISGGYIAAGGVVQLTIDSGKTGYIILPNKTVLPVVTSLTTTNTGIAGKINYYIPKDSMIVSVTSSGLSGLVEYNGPRLLTISANSGITSLIADNTQGIDAQVCSLTAKSIGDILQNLYSKDVLSCALNFSGGNNALEGAVDTYLQNTYSITYATIYALLVTTNGGTILIDEV